MYAPFVSIFLLPFFFWGFGLSGNIGVPTKLLFEAEGMKITVELKSGEIYRGLLESAEDTMNVTLTDVIRTARNGQINKLSSCYLRGSSVRFIALPELLKNAPIFQKVTQMKRKLEQHQDTRTTNNNNAGGNKDHNKRKRTE
mmetsp:Transcript_30255/g.42874  ORF Transcript_30255/g.42874 Transcript_30255/m.42874 type:complete len:142 (-) Transcript_30255:40-465(-)